MIANCRLGVERIDVATCRVLVWAPLATRVKLHLLSPERSVALERITDGYHSAVVEGIAPGSSYLFQLDEEGEYPDPASRFQPQGVHGPSQAVEDHFAWDDDGWTGLPIESYVIYELHAGTYTPEGTFDAIIRDLDYLKDLGITAIELMPVAQFPGDRNWGYDGVYPFAVQSSYGGPEGLQRLVNAAHCRGLAVILDVVYNHLGPEGNYLSRFGPYFTGRYLTPWGPAVNFDGPGSREVRHYVIENALYWLRDFHMDALRLDAVHGIFDHSETHILRELADEVARQARALHRSLHLVAESDLNESRLVRSAGTGGFGLDAVWNDDFHHALHALLTGERSGYYQDFGKLEDLSRAWSDGFVYAGQYSRYRARPHGDSSRDLPGSKFVVFAQNHDQVGNRVRGERLSTLTSFEGLKLAAGAVLLSPFIPLLFMGEEYGETAPFLYFVSHSDPALIDAVRRGRREEFSAFAWSGEVPDPQSEATFERSRLNHALRDCGEHRILYEFYKELIRLRNSRKALANLTGESSEVTAFEERQVLLVRRWCENEQMLIALNFHDRSERIPLSVPPGFWQKILDSEDARWGGQGGSVGLEVAARSVCLYARQTEADK